eukprot:CAMPEP_0118862782 /NCGR_PEP_ID=MMETSP1163-20130328/7874_1 /TAXON_ID=124430 /ORGANISM="Phaeomonas parva, Strain CCMP2877" /LENGTH=322 /DNA_ID=CAMNT_0006796719 /DNA_START=119 /DNA_END=1087 /DNA_ORIENTATION=-
MSAKEKNDRGRKVKKEEGLDEGSLMDSHGDPLSFEQYHAKMNRKRKIDTQKTEDGEDEEPAEGGGKRTKFGSFVELFEVQLAVGILIFLDLVAAVAEMLLHYRGDLREQIIASGAGEDDPAVQMRLLIVNLAAQALGAFSAFTVIFFTMECLVLMASFGLKFWGHIGYVSDVVLLSVFMFVELTSRQVEIRLLGVVRLWRLIRLSNLVVAELKGETKKVEGLLEKEKEKVQEVTKEKMRVEDAMEREIAARKGLEDMLLAYRDEVDTLNEALRIAASDIFDVAEGDDEDAEAAAAARKKGNGGVRIVVGEDGKWERKTETGK